MTPLPLFRQALLNQGISSFSELVEELGALGLEVRPLVRILSQIEEKLLALGGLEELPVPLPQGRPDATLQFRMRARLPEEFAGGLRLVGAGEDARNVPAVEQLLVHLDLG